ncbi:MAG: ATP-binding protein [Clostridia bacterium]|nr:ATP-binding protein [Clostridia bacterium]
MKKDVKTLTVEAKKENLDCVISFITGFFEEHGCSMKTVMQAQLCAEEVFVNIVSYAYGKEGGSVEISLSENEGSAEIVFADSGVPYDPIKKEDPDLTLSADKRRIGGLGIFLVKKNMDKVSYAYENGKNVLTMLKRIR